MTKLILASNSPRRRQLLSQLNYDYIAIPAVGEEYTNAANCVDMVKEIACHKALEVYKANPEAVVLGCDTVVDLDGEALGETRGLCRRGKYVDKAFGTQPQRTYGRVSCRNMQFTYLPKRLRLCLTN